MRSVAAAVVRGTTGTLCFLALLSGSASAQVWTDWTTTTVGAPGSAQGFIPLPGGNVGVTYAGQVLGGSQTACGTAWLDNTFPAYDGTAIVDPPGTYNSPLPCDMIQINSTGMFGFTFASPVTDLFMAFVSIGRASSPVSYTFSAPFTIIDEGAGPFGDGALASLPGNTLEGREGHGVIHFAGTFSSLNWTVTNSEHWHGFTVGAMPADTVIPEPATIALLGSGLLGLGLVARKRRSRDAEPLE